MLSPLLAALTNSCTATWITTNGVSGRLVTGKDAYADRSIFLPAAIEFPQSEDPWEDPGEDPGEEPEE